MGVWIETGHTITYDCGAESHPAWVCGLKLRLSMHYRSLLMSHPAWVCGLKQCDMTQILLNQESHPAWVCGLKPMLDWNLTGQAPSHPAWVCGLKQHGVRKGRFYLSHTLRGCVD